MKVWVVGVSECEGNYTICICATKQIAERELFKERDRLIKEWKELDEHQTKSIEEYCLKHKKPIWIDNMYKRMINNLLESDYEKWNNFPHDCPYIYETKIIGE